MFSSIYDTSLRLISVASVGFDFLLDALFITFRQLLANAGLDLSGINITFFNLILDQSIITLAVGGGLAFFVVYSVVKFFIP